MRGKRVPCTSTDTYSCGVDHHTLVLVLGVGGVPVTFTTDDDVFVTSFGLISPSIQR